MHVGGAQLARKEAAAAAAAAARYCDGSAARPARDSAEEAWARALAAAGREHSDAGLLAIAAEGLMNVSPWDYYQVLPGAECTGAFDVLEVSMGSVGLQCVLVVGGAWRPAQILVCAILN